MPTQITDGSTTHDFLFITGGINLASPVLEELSPRPGVDGVAFRKVADDRGPSYQLQCIRDHATFSAAKTALANYRDFIGKIVSVTDSRGLTYTNQLVVNVETREGPRAIGLSDGGLETSPECVLRTTWTLKDTSS